MKLWCENLESRRYLAASLDPFSKLLTVTGTSRNDMIRIAIGGVNLNVTVNGRTNSFQLKKVGSILIDALGGSDDVDIKNEIKIRSTILGGSGNDKLGGGGASDDIDGGTGSDVITGGPGSDIANYSSRSANVIVAIGGGMDDGEAGEKDNVQYDIEQIIGGSGNDKLTGSGSNNTLIGNGGDDLLKGGAGNDVMDGGNDDDTARGGTGDDTFTGGAGSDWVDYSDHDSQAQMADAGVNINIDGAPDSGLMKNFVQQEFDQINTDVENVIGSSGQDFVLALGDVANTIQSRGGDDFITPTDGNDTVDAGEGNDSILGGAGDDTMIGGPDTSFGPDQDFLAGEDGDDSIVGGADNDTVIGAVGNDTARGGDGDDGLFGEVDDDSLFGDAGDDLISGGVGGDTIQGGDGIDSLSGDDDDDLVEDDGTIIPDLSDEEEAPAPLAALDADAIDTLDGGGGNDTVNGGQGQAFLFGSDGNDTINGGAGTEFMNGGLGDDSLAAGAGDDTVVGDFGLDILLGDAGNDVFVNGDGQTDQIDGGDDIDLVQFEPAGADVSTNTEGEYDQPEDSLPSAQVALRMDEPLFAPREFVALAAAAPFVVSAGVLRISGESDAGGAPLDDNISLSQSGSTITLIENGNTYAISASGLKGIFIDSGSGNDFIGLATASGTSTINLPATVAGGRGDDVIRGGNGNDLIIGGLDDDQISGNKGNDVLNGGTEVLGQNSDGRDTIRGGAGLSDSVRYDTRSNPLSLNLDGVANDGASGEADLIGSDVENLFGGRGNDTLTGNGAGNLLAGGNGSDSIRGGGGNDKLIGATPSGDSVDTIYGEAGTDIMTLRGDKKGDRYNLGAGQIENALFVTKDSAPGGGFLDQPI